jgi:hypothetical protein
MAAFEHMIHRMISLPLSKNGEQKELEHILLTARLNGYSEQTIKNLIDKRTKEEHKKSLTSLSQMSTQLKRISMDYNYYSKQLRPVLRKLGFDVVFTSRSNQLQNLMTSTKDPIDILEKSGIYKITCDECQKVYIGQTKRTLRTRFKEHVAEVTKANKDTNKGLVYHFKSKVAEHIYNHNHFLNLNHIKILRHIRNPWKLNVAESIEIYKENTTKLLNKDQGNGYSWLFKFIPKRNTQ